MNNKGMFVSIFVGLMIVSIFLFVFYGVYVEATAEEVGTSDCLCYDRYENEIDGLVCNCSIYDYNWFFGIFPSPEEQRIAFEEKLK